MLFCLSQQCADVLRIVFIATGEKDGYSPRNKYRIANLIIHVPRGFNNYAKQTNVDNPFVALDPWSIPQVASVYNMEKLRKMIEQRYPSIFVYDESATPIDVNVYCTNEEKELEWTILVPYIVSLGVLPCYQRTISKCEISVRNAGAYPKLQKNSVTCFQTDLKLTCFSPLGLSQFDSSSVATVQKHNSGVMKAPHLDRNALNDLLMVFSEAVSDAVVAQLKILETGKSGNISK